ncbi:MAG TPA: TonB-dependent receptor [Bacteroidia bacterium]|nr:TonB-dependent receptor [Bacteroidia bacterium]
MKAQSGIQLEAVGSVSPIILDHVQKINDPAKTKDTVLPTPQFTYPVQTKKYATVVTIDTIKAAKMGAEPLNKLYRTYARFGIGNYSTMLGEFSASSLRSKTGAWGVYLSHISAASGPKDVPGEFSGYSKQDVNAFGKVFLKHHTLGGDFDFNRNAISEYGSAADTSFFKKNAARQQYNLYSVNGGLVSHYTDSTMINHQVNIGYYHLNDPTKTNEDNIKLDVTAGRYIRTEHLGADLGLDFNHNNSEHDTAMGTIMRFAPAFTTEGNKFKASVGFGLFIDHTSASTLTYFLPQGAVSYDIIDHFIIPYVQLTNHLDRNNFRSLTMVNPYLLPSEVFNTKNTLSKYELQLGLKGSLGDDINYDVHVMRRDLKNMPLFVNTTEAQDVYRNKFTVIYDDATVVNVHGELGWRHLQKLQITATGDWYKYTMATEAHPWYTPTLRLSLNADYNLEDKIVAKLNVYYLNGQFVKPVDVLSGTSPELKGLVDVNLGLEYRYSKFLSAFLNLNNLANQRYYRWYGYPMQKFNFVAGLTYTF